MAVKGSTSYRVLLFTANFFGIILIIWYNLIGLTFELWCDKIKRKLQWRIYK